MQLCKVMVVTFLLLAMASVAAAQEEYPKVELAMGYSLMRLSSTGVLEPFTQNGGSANVAYNLSRHFGLVGDFGAYNNNNIQGLNVDNTMFTYLFGPRFSERGKRVTVFANVLAGGAHITGSGVALIGAPSGTIATRFDESNNSFALLAGGGLDISAGKHFSVRPGQFDYLLTRFNPRGASETQNNFRYSAMVVFKFGQH